MSLKEELSAIMKKENNVEEDGFIINLNLIPPLKLKDAYFISLLSCNNLPEEEDWICLPHKEVYKKLRFSPAEVRTIIRHLKEKNLIETKLKRTNDSPKLHYKVNQKLLYEMTIEGIQRSKRGEKK